MLTGGTSENDHPLMLMMLVTPWLSALAGARAVSRCRAETAPR